MFNPKEAPVTIAAAVAAVAGAVAAAYRPTVFVVKPEQLLQLG